MEDNIFDKVHEVDLEKTMKDSYIDYAMSVIASRFRGEAFHKSRVGGGRSS